MGYRTRFSLRIAADPNKDLLNDVDAVGLVEKYLLENEEMMKYFYPPDELDDGVRCPTFNSEEMKWYDHESYMRGMSLSLPDVLLELSGEGEDSGDMWRKYFLNGKMQVCRAKIIYPQFDIEKLR